MNFYLVAYNIYLQWSKLKECFHLNITGITKIVCLQETYKYLNKAKKCVTHPVQLNIYIGVKQGEEMCPILFHMIAT